MLAFYARFRRPALLLGGLLLFALLSLLVSDFLANRTESVSVPPPVISAPKHSPRPVSSARFVAISTTKAQQRIKFVTCLCRDRQGRVWIGTEDEGVWCYDPAAPANAA